MERLLNRRKYFVIFITVSSLAITYLHYSTLPGVHDLHNIFAELYYIPLLLGALAFGLKGAILTFIFITVLYVPFVFMNWTGTYLSVTNKLLHALFSGSFAILAGILVDREKRHQDQSEKDRYLSGLGQAASAIVHDLKNPIITILGFARRIRDGKGDTTAASETVIDAAEKMQVLVQDTLFFAKSVQIHAREENIHEVINNACRFCETKAAEEGVVLLQKKADEHIRLFIDRLHFERALVNLINNAIEASEKDKTVIVSTGKGHNSFMVKVKDNGSGMDRETAENIFLPFYTKKGSGTGLGMAIAKKIIEGHGGKIHIRSMEQKGTEVIIELPQKNAQ